MAKLREKYQQRLKSETELKTFVEELELFRKARENTIVSLQETKRKKEREEAEKKREALKKLETGEEEEEDTTTTATKPATKKKKDIYMNETSRILADYIALVKSPSMAKR